MNNALRDRMTKAKVRSGGWNRGKAVGQKAPFSPDQVHLIRSLLENDARKAELLCRAMPSIVAVKQTSRSPSLRALRDLALFTTAISTMLRARDLLALRVADVCDHDGGILERVTLRQAKTGKAHVVELSRYARDALARWVELSGKSFLDALFTDCRANRPTASNPISRVQYASLVKSWAAMARLDPRAFSTHSTRRTKSAAIYARTRDVAACQQLLGHQSIGSTSKYLGIDRAKAFDVAKLVEL